MLDWFTQAMNIIDAVSGSTDISDLYVNYQEVNKMHTVKRFVHELI